jgi:hypothetical protein
MTDRDDIRQRTLEAAHLQMIEGNPLDADDIAMFEMFDREGFSVEQQRAYVITRIRVHAETKTKQ